jgi:ribosome-associated toxin RatA of RatAB toxin-antitoxin module
MSDVQVTADFGADAGTVYRLVSDVTRMGEWSPETRSCRWLNGTAPQVGARFRGTNQYGFRRWSTTCTVTAAEDGRRFAFSVSWGPFSISEWSYAIDPTAEGCTVIETWVDKRPAWLRVALMPAMGVVDRAAHNRAGMVATLAALKSAAETAATAGPSS